jgi:DNA polymerase V
MEMVTKVEAIYYPDSSTECERPLFMAPVTAGFPSPAEDYIEGRLDLNRYLIKHPAATFFVKVAGDSMIDAGIHPGDIAVVDGELTVKRIRIKNGRIRLMPENENYKPIEIEKEMKFDIWGVVTNVIHPL